MGKALKVIEEIRTNDPLQEKTVLVNQMGLTCERIGNWLWVDGAKAKDKIMLMKAGFRFSSNKLMWYYTTEKSDRRSRRNYSIEELRILYK